MVASWCPCVPLGGWARQHQQRQQLVGATGDRSSSATSSCARQQQDSRPFTLSYATSAQPRQPHQQHNGSQCCRKLLRLAGSSNKVLLFPEEGWARSASSSYWTLTPFWWSRSRCKVVEVAGTRRYSTQARMLDNGTGTLYIVGSFKRMTADADFKLFLTSNVSASDFNMGYSMTGTLERGCKKTNSFQMTHFAVIRRRDYERAYRDQSPT